MSQSLCGYELRVLREFDDPTLDPLPRGSALNTAIEVLKSRDLLTRDGKITPAGLAAIEAIRAENQARHEADVARRIAEYRINPSPRTVCFVIVVVRPGHASRYYHGKSKTGRLITAWGLCGAMLFNSTDSEEYEKAVRFIETKGGRVVIAKIKLCDAATERPAATTYTNRHPHLSFVEENP